MFKIEMEYTITYPKDNNKVTFVDSYLVNVKSKEVAIQEVEKFIKGKQSKRTYDFKVLSAKRSYYVPVNCSMQHDTLIAKIY